MSALVCELSGETITGADSDGDLMVVTPSGHICLRRLLLQKLSENGGNDPFELSRPLSEDDLIELKTDSTKVPPRAAATSMGSLLTQLQQEYDALLLELFDTRRVLEETRQELSQALYQNDAATRVVARLAIERDAARQHLESSSMATLRVEAGAAVSEEQQPPLKKAKLDDTTDSSQVKLPLINDIPDAHFQQMASMWQCLHDNRKSQQKERVANAPAVAQFSLIDTKAYHKTKCKGIVRMASRGHYLVTAGSDKEIIAFDAMKEQVTQKIVSNQKIQAVDINDSCILVGSTSKGRSKGGGVTAYSLLDGSTLGTVVEDSSSSSDIVDVRLHPDGAHALVAYEAGRLKIVSLETFSPISVFEVKDQNQKSINTYTCGALHPDGLIYIAGTYEGDLVLWDLKSKSLGATLSGVEGQERERVAAIAISENGYHIAVAHPSKVCLWDLRKQKEIAEISGPVDSVAFDDSGKYLAMGGEGSIKVVTVKDQAEVASLEVSRSDALSWIQNKLAASSNKTRDIAFFGSA